MSKHPPPPPPRLGAPRSQPPRGAPAPPRRGARLPRSASNFLPTAICLGGGEPRRDKEAASQARGEGRPCHAEAARPRSRENWRSPLRFLSRSEGLPRLPYAVMGGIGPGDLQPAGLGLDLPSAVALRRGRAGQGSLARPLLAVSLTADPGHATTPTCGLGCAPALAGTRRGLWTQRLGISTGRPGGAVLKSLLLPPLAPTGNLNRNSPLKQLQIL